MKLYFIFLFFLIINISSGQVTNLRTGVWSDPTIWSNNIIPGDTTRILLSYDILVDINASCKSMHTNGKQVIINAGLNLLVSGVAAPVASFTSSGSTTVPTTIQFVNNSINAISYLWNFGDPASGVNNTSTLVNPSHHYQTLGPYLTSTVVKLTATGPGGSHTDSAHMGLNCVPTVVEVGPTINVPTTWDQCHIYHISSFVSVNAPLTIEGATVTFDLQKGMIVGTNGKITSRHAVFTSSASNKQYGDWAFISFGSSSGNSITGGAIMYAGYASLNQERALDMGSGANNSVTNVIFEYTAGTLNQLTAALDMSRAPNSCVATGNIFFSNHGHPVLIGIASNFDNSNTFSFNQSNAIYVDCVHITQAPSITWTNKQVPYVLGGWHSNSWVFGTNKILVLGDSVVLKFARYTTPGFTLSIPNGTFQLQNYNGPGVVFTAYTDDSYLGDSNANGASTGTSGYWEGIQTTGPFWYAWPNIYFAAH